MADVRFTIEEFRAGDGYRWHYRRFLPAEEARADLVCLHGIQSHGGWYEHSCDELRRAGFAASFLDRRGSGLNKEARGDAPGFRCLLDDIAEFCGAARGNLAGKKLFLLAISWGGKLAVALQRRHPGLVDGLVLLCPGFFAQVRPPFKDRLGILFSRLFRPSSFFPIPLDEAELFTATPHWLRFLRQDTLTQHYATARFLVESVRLDGYLRFCPRRVTVPVLLLLAEKDRIIDNSRTRRFIEKFATADKQIIEYAGAHHTLEFEPEPERFIRDVRTWLERHL